MAGFQKQESCNFWNTPPNLASLEVDSVRFTPQGIAALAKLEMLTTLNLTNAELSDGDVGPLSKLNESKKTKLIELNIRGNGITRDGVQRIQDALVGGKIFGGGYDPKRNLVREIVQMNGTVNVSSPDNDSQEIIANGTPAVALRLLWFAPSVSSDSHPRLSTVIALRLESPGNRCFQNLGEFLSHDQSSWYLHLSRDNRSSSFGNFQGARS